MIRTHYFHLMFELSKETNVSSAKRALRDESSIHSWSALSADTSHLHLRTWKVQLPRGVAQAWIQTLFMFILPGIVFPNHWLSRVQLHTKLSHESFAQRSYLPLWYLTVAARFRWIRSTYVGKILSYLCCFLIVSPLLGLSWGLSSSILDEANFEICIVSRQDEWHRLRV